MALDKVQITGFKSIERISLELTQLNVVIGPNGAGKSNLIGAFRMLGQIMQGRLQEYVARQGGAARLLHHGPKRSAKISLRFDFGRNGYSLDLVPTTGDDFTFARESTYFRGDYTQSGGSILGIGHKEAKLPDVAKSSPARVASYVMASIRNWVPYHFHDTSDSSPPKLTQDVSDNRYLAPDAGNLAAFLFRLQEKFPENFHRIEACITRVMPFFAGFTLAPLASNTDKIKLEWRQRGSDAYLDGSAFSDGTLRFVCLATLLLQPAELMPSVILLDEPELGLHPAALTLLVEMFRDASMRSQIIAATQSVTLLDQLTPDEVIVAEQEDGASKFRRLDEASLREWLEDYSLGELWLKNVLGGRPR